MKATIVLAAMLVMCVALAADAGADRSPEGWVMRHGMYKNRSHVRIATDRVPLKLGAGFAIQFSIVGLPYERVEIVCRARHPRTVPGGNGVNNENAFARTYVTREGRLTGWYYGVRLWRKPALIEGKWTLYCSYGDQVLVSKDFFLFHPE